MGKVIIALVAVAGVFFLSHKYLTSVWASGPTALAFDGFQPSWGLLLVGIAGLIVYSKVK
jgi:hypothetical protein